MPLESRKKEIKKAEGNNKTIIIVATGVIIIAFIYLFSDFNNSNSIVSNKECGCYIPSVIIPSYADSFDDKKENWEHKECAIAESDEYAEKIHVYVYYNSIIDKYRCELRYSWPGEECRMSSKTAGSQAISTADISKGDFENGKWKTYDFWFVSQLNKAIWGN